MTASSGRRMNGIIKRCKTTVKFNEKIVLEVRIMNPTKFFKPFLSKLLGPKEAVF